MTTASSLLLFLLLFLFLLFVICSCYCYCFEALDCVVDIKMDKCWNTKAGE